MANTIKPKRSYTASATPTLAAGELAINATDGKIWLGNSAGTANVLVSSLGFADHTGSVAVTQGGTGATTAANARTNLGLAIGSNVQAWDADLDAIAAIVGTSGLLKKTAANTWTLDTTSYGTGTVTSVAAGSYLTGGTITTSGTLAVDATSANTASKVVARDASGNFSAGTITASLTGTASTATNLAGGGAGQIHYQSASNTTAMLAAGTSGQILRSNGTAAPSWETQGLFHSGRLTLESGVPVSTTDQTGKTTIYFTPYNGDKISLYDGTTWATYTFAELSLALGTLTSGKNYDVFLYNNSGTLTLESLAWTSDTARATSLVLTNGVYLKSGATTRRYLGTFRTTSTTTTEDSVTKRFVFNVNNQVSKNVRKVDTTFSWTYQAAAYRYANNSSTNRIEVVSGLSSFINLTSAAFFYAGANLQGARTAIGEDSSTSPASECIITDGASIPNYYVGTTSFLTKMPTAGYHYYSWLESTGPTYVMTFYGADYDYRRTGLIGYFIC